MLFLHLFLCCLGTDGGTQYVAGGSHVAGERAASARRTRPTNALECVIEITPGNDPDIRMNNPYDLFTP